MSTENQNPSQPPASERASQQASQPQAIAFNGQKESSNQPVNNRRTQKTEDTEHYNGLGRVTTNTPAIFTATHPFVHDTAVLNVLIKMKNDNKSHDTINFARKALNRLSQSVKLNEPEAVKAFIASLETRNGYKRNLSIAYNQFCKYYKIQWEMPNYKLEAQNIRLPTREKLNMIIADASETLALKLSISMETGLRPVELCRLRARDIDIDHKAINPITAKNGAPRTPKITEALAVRVQEYITRRKLQPNDNCSKETLKTTQNVIAQSETDSPRN